MGIALFYEGHLQEAEHIHRYVYSERQRILGNGHHETIKSRANIAMTINEMGHYAQAETLYRGALTLFQLIIGPTHPDTIKTYTNLATNLHDQGRYEDADDVVTTILPTMQSIQGEEAHGNYIEALEFHSILLHWMQMYAIALDVAGQVYEQRLISVGYAHYDTQRALSHVRDLAENCEEEQSTEAFGPCILAITT
jgi:tetratricopeptide (TPR) repeat protein